MSYKNTFITSSEDSTVDSAVEPVPRNGKPTIASIQYELIKHNPYKYTEEDVQFKTYLIKHQMELHHTEEMREHFFSKPQACFRASPLVKKYGWGIHYDEQGKIALYGVNSEAYNRFLDLENITLLKGMRSKRK
ncbi:hypothetical protein JOC94_004465 [Bacillus thermophilus]|uniref:Uncharacterized protein n=1 Tax=Siminovitchia thermophila TaxID=1245522 RepID=A0ABS2RCR6_9BACI|nr:DUF6157 family protein [Siminovitchia thermophila]MBM7717437.1 hypothetical protein [Siminovitchia thermophila]